MADRDIPRLGLCCLFREAPIKFRATTARFARTLSARARVAHLGAIALHNAAATSEAIAWCARHDSGAFRVNRQVLPLATHPELGDPPAALGGDGAIETAFRRARSSRRGDEKEPRAIPRRVREARGS